jgi:hypothetical protein
MQQKNKAVTCRIVLIILRLGSHHGDCPALLMGLLSIKD